MLKVITFDICGTLINRSYFDYMYNEAIPRLYAEKKHLSVGEAKAHVLKEYDRIGIKGVRWYLPEFWFQYSSLDEDPVKIFQVHKCKVEFYPGVTSVLRNLNKKYSLIVASGVPKP